MLKVLRVIGPRLRCDGQIRTDKGGAELGYEFLLRVRFISKPLPAEISRQSRSP
jgi:hypothetical protein